MATDPSFLDVLASALGALAIPHVPELRALAPDRLPCAKLLRDPSRRFEHILDALSRHLREAGDSSTWCPIVLGSEAAMAEHAEALLYAPSPDALLSGPASTAAARLDAGDTIADVVEGWEDEDAPKAAPTTPSLLDEPAAPWRPLPPLD